jgi:hypothetical protein
LAGHSHAINPRQPGADDSTRSGQLHDSSAFDLQVGLRKLDVGSR